MTAEELDRAEELAAAVRVAREQEHRDVIRAMRPALDRKAWELGCAGNVMLAYYVYNLEQRIVALEAAVSNLEAGR